MEEHDEEKAEPRCKDIGDEHGAVVETRLRPVVLSAMVALLVHFEGLFERKTAGFKQVALVTGGAFKAENAV